MRPRALRFLLCLMAGLAYCVQPSAVYSCGPVFDVAIFTYTEHPDRPYTHFAAGQLGLVLPSFHPRFLYGAYHLLSGQTFSISEKSSLVEMWRGKEMIPSDARGGHDAQLAWQQARAEVAGSERRQLLQTYKQEDAFYSFHNCLADAFATAALTLHERVRLYGAHHPALRDWVAAQDTVFENCGGGSFVPDPVRNQDALLRADREYQIAAAYFYSSRFDEARGHFQQIAATPSSPWHRLARYLVLRCYVRQAMLTPDEPAIEILRKADREASLILADRSLAEYQSATQRLRAYIRFRLDPADRLGELSRHLEQSHPGKGIDQDVWDYSLLVENRKLADPSDLTDWIHTFHIHTSVYNDDIGTSFEYPDREHEHALERWRTRRTLPWLIAALASAQPDDSELPEEIAAAKAIAPESPGFTSVLYYRSRALILLGRADEARPYIDSNMPRIHSAGARNALLELRSRIATDLPDFLHAVQQYPVGIGWQEWGDTSEITDADLKPARPLFSPAGTAVLNSLPLDSLEAAMREPSLARALRRRIAIAAVVRAALREDSAHLQDMETAAADLVLEWRTGLAAYAQATNPAERRFAAAIMLAHTPGAQPLINSGFGRSTRLGEIDEYRNNWWCVTDLGISNPDSEQQQEPEVRDFASHPDANPLPQPKFAGGKQFNVPDGSAAPDYLGKIILSWVRQHPKDRRNPEALALTVRATRFGCGGLSTKAVSHEAFQVLHRRYPRSAWARKTPYWFSSVE
jgi:tetratricopeptide (TPR) repeat protein